MDRRLEPHDVNQLELKLGYICQPGVSKQRYHVETFIFVPRTLGITSHSYPATRFYQDTTAFVRLATPKVALNALAAEASSEPWFTPLRDAVDAVLNGQQQRVNPIVKQLKFLGCIYRSALRDEAALLISLVEDFRAATAQGVQTKIASLVSRLDTFMQDAQSAIARLRELGKLCEHAVMPEEARETWKAVDEFVTLFSEEVTTKLVEVVDELLRQDEHGTGFQEARERLAGFAIEAYEYRRSRGYPSFLMPDDENETFTYRRRLLKRMVSSVLYLDIRQEDAGRMASNLVGMVAAAMAMLFAVLVALWAQVQWDMFTWPFILVMVLSYMVKDRIKELAKRGMGRRISRWMPDHVVKVRDASSGKIIGTCRESFHIESPRKVDREILELRHIDHPTSVESSGRPEKVMCYSKEVILSSDGLQEQMQGVQGLNDIIRFNLGTLRARMDEPTETYRVVHPTTKNLIALPCARVYHVNLVLRISSGSSSEERVETERVRVILDQRGIKRIETIDRSSPAGTGERSGVEPVAEPAEFA